MQYITDHKVATIVFIIITITVLILLSNMLFVIYSGTSVAVPEIPREKTTVGSGDKLNYLILGDSTSVSQGSPYEDGYVVGSAAYLGESYEVTYQNFGVSGARVNDVLTDQLPRSAEFTPDIVLVSIGANDVTHITSLESVEIETIQIINTLRERNPEVEIVLTGSASMGDVKRFPYPLRWIIGFRTRQINKVFLRVATSSDVTFAYVARDTGPQFAANQDTFFAADNFHPNANGYAVWTPVINKALSSALAK